MMSPPVLQVAPRKALELKPGPDPGVYSTEFPLSMCFGVVTHGGMVIAFAQKAVIEHNLKLSKKADHRHVRNLAVSFFRPVMPHPQKVFAYVNHVNSNKAWTTMHVEVKQDQKICLAGYITLTDLYTSGEMSYPTGWSLSPPPVPVDVQALTVDNDPNWVSFHVPFTATEIRRAQSYVKFYLPAKKPLKLNVLDQWITPNWRDEELPQGAVWTDDLLHFAIDNIAPILNFLIQNKTNLGIPFYELVIRAGLEQRRARAEGRSDEVLTEGLRDADLIPLMISTLHVSTEIKKPLPSEGTKWLFLRVTTKSIKDNRTDYDMNVLDSMGDLVAVSQHTLQIVSMNQKRAKKKQATL